MVSKIMLFFDNQFRDNMKGTYTIIKAVPNIISASRGLVSLLLFIFPFGSPLFWLCYLWCGCSDMIDGPLARRMKVANSTGAIIDSIADIMFVICAAVTTLPHFSITRWMWICIAIIAAVRIVNIISGIVCHGKVTMLHTGANKLTGLLLFVLPIVVTWVQFNIAAGIVIAVAMFAAIQEGHLIRTCDSVS